MIIMINSKIIFIYFSFKIEYKYFVALFPTTITVISYMFKNIKNNSTIFSYEISVSNQLVLIHFGWRNIFKLSRRIYVPTYLKYNIYFQSKT